MKNKLIFNDVTLPKGATLKDYAEAFQREFERIKKELDTLKLRKKIKAYPIKDIDICEKCKFGTNYCETLGVLKTRCRKCVLYLNSYVPQAYDNSCVTKCYCLSIRDGEPCKMFEKNK